MYNLSKARWFVDFRIVYYVNIPVTVKFSIRHQEVRPDYSQNVPKSKRPLVKTSPNWSKRPQKLVKTSQWYKMLVKTSPKSFFILCFM